MACLTCCVQVYRLQALWRDTARKIEQALIASEEAEAGEAGEAGEPHKAAAAAPATEFTTTTPAEPSFGHHPRLSRIDAAVTILSAALLEVTACMG